MLKSDLQYQAFKPSEIARPSEQKVKFADDFQIDKSSGDVSSKLRDENIKLQKQIGNLYSELDKTDQKLLKFMETAKLQESQVKKQQKHYEQKIQQLLQTIEQLKLQASKTQVQINQMSELQSTNFTQKEQNNKITLADKNLVSTYTQTQTDDQNLAIMKQLALDNDQLLKERQRLTLDLQKAKLQIAEMQRQDENDKLQSVSNVELNKQLEEFEQLNEELRNKNIELTQQLSDKQQEIAKAQQKYAAQQKFSADDQVNIKNLKQQLVDLENESQKQLNIQKNENDRFKEQLSSLRQQLNAKYIEIAQLLQNIQLAKTNDPEKDVIINQLKEQVAKQVQNIQKIKHNSEVSLEINTLREKLQSREEQCKEQETQILAQSVQIAEFHNIQEIKLQKQKSTSRLEMLQFTEQLESVEQESQAKSQTIKQLLQSQYLLEQNLSSEYKTEIERLAVIESQYIEQKNKIEEQNIQLQEKSDQIRALTQQNLEYTILVEQLNSQIANFQSQRDVYEQQNAFLLRKVQNQQNDLERTIVQNQNNVLESQRLRSDLAQLQERENLNQSTLKVQKSSDHELVQLKVVYQKTVEDNIKLTAQVDQQQQVIDSLNNKPKPGQDEIKNMKQQNFKLNQSILSYHQILNSKDSKIVELEQTIVQIKADHKNNQLDIVERNELRIQNQKLLCQLKLQTEELTSYKIQFRKYQQDIDEQKYLSGFHSQSKTKISATQIAELQNRLDVKEHENTKLQNIINQNGHQQEMEHLQYVLVQKESQLKELQEALLKQTEQIQQFKYQLHTQNRSDNKNQQIQQFDVNNSLQLGYNSLSQQCQQLAQEKLQLCQQVQVLQTQLQQSRTEANDEDSVLRQKLFEAQQCNVEFEEELSTFRKTQHFQSNVISDQKSQIQTQSQIQLQQLTLENQQLNIKLNEIQYRNEQYAKDMKQKLSLFCEQNQVLTQQLQDTLQQQVVNTDNSNLQEHILDLENKLRLIQQQYSNLNSDYTKLQQYSVNQTQSLYMSQQQSIKTGSNIELSQQVATLKQQLSNYADQNTKQQESLARKQIDLDNLRQTNADLEKQLQSMEYKVDDSELRQLQQKNQCLLQENAFLVSQLAQQQNLLSSQSPNLPKCNSCQQLKQEISILRDENETMIQKLNSVSFEIARLQNISQQSNKEVIFDISSLQQQFKMIKLDQDRIKQQVLNTYGQIKSKIVVVNGVKTIQQSLNLVLNQVASKLNSKGTILTLPDFQQKNEKQVLDVKNAIKIVQDQKQGLRSVRQQNVAEHTLLLQQIQQFQAKIQRSLMQADEAISQYKEKLFVSFMQDYRQESASLKTDQSPNQQGDNANSPFSSNPQFKQEKQYSALQQRIQKSSKTSRASSASNLAALASSPKNSPLKALQDFISKCGSAVASDFAPSFNTARLLFDGFTKLMRRRSRDLFEGCAQIQKFVDSLFEAESVIVIFQALVPQDDLFGGNDVKSLIEALKGDKEAKSAFQKSVCKCLLSLWSPQVESAFFQLILKQTKPIGGAMLDIDDVINYESELHAELFQLLDTQTASEKFLQLMIALRLFGYLPQLSICEAQPLQISEEAQDLFVGFDQERKNFCAIAPLVGDSGAMLRVPVLVE